jgi:hypothetical protein
MYAHFRTTTRSLASLAHLHLQLTSSFNEWQAAHLPRVTYDNIISTLKSKSLEHLSLGVSKLKGKLTDEDFVDKLRPITTFARLPNLRRFDALEEAFFSVDRNFHVCELPATIQNIGIIDATWACKRYAKHLLDNREKWPALDKV